MDVLALFFAGVAVGAIIIGVLAWLLRPKPPDNGGVLLAVDLLQELHKKLDTLSLPGWSVDTEDPPNYRYRGLLVPERAPDLRVPGINFGLVHTSEDPNLVPDALTRMPDSQEGP